MSEQPTVNIFHVEWIGERAPFAKAFVAAQKATEAVKKASTNPAFRSKYADLAEVVEAVVPALNANGIGVLQFPGSDNGEVIITTELLHESGSSVRSTLRMRPVKSDPQGVGSAITYGRRYSLLAMVGAAPEDDDGNAASKPVRDYSPASSGPDFEGAEGHKGRSAYAAKKDGGSERFNELRKEISELGTMTEVGLFKRDRTEEIKTFPEAWRKILREDLEEQIQAIESGALVS